MEILNSIAIIFASSVVSYFSFLILAKKLQEAGITGIDVNKPYQKEVPESTGIAAVFTFILILFFLIFLKTFGIVNLNINTENLLIIALVGLIIGFIGLVDDMISLPQTTKVFLPMLGAIPLIALKSVGSTSLYIPIIGTIDFGIAYFLLLIPLFITVASNLTNMLAGFNGLEYGMSIPLYLGSLVLGLINSNPTLIIPSSIMLGISLSGFYLGFKGKIFPGDVGTLTIGGIMSAQLILGNLESYHLVFIIYFLDFIIKAINGFPSDYWWGRYKNGKLYSLKEKPVGLAQYVMKLFNGISEKNLVLFFVLSQLVVVTLFILIYKIKIFT